MKEDDLYARPLGNLEPFRFDGRTAEVFADMVNRSVPGYGVLADLTALIAARYAQPNGRVYDLGASLGAVSLAMQSHLPDGVAGITAVDNAPAMTAKLSERLKELELRIPIKIVTGDVRTVPLENATVVVMNLTLQFIPQVERQAIISKIFRALSPGGALLLAEKIRPESQAGLYAELQESFKEANGYSALEISQKRTALENVLIAENEGMHLDRLRTTGFHPVVRFFQCLEFTAWLAVKPTE